MSEYLEAEDWLVKYHWDEWKIACNIKESYEEIAKLATSLGWDKNYKNEKNNNSRFGADFSKYFLPGENR